MADLSTTRRDASGGGCSGWDIASDHEDKFTDDGTSTGGGGSRKKRRDQSLLSTQRFSKNERVLAGNSQHYTNGQNIGNVNLAKELTALTFQERERVMDELHGVASTPDETPEFVATSLEALDRAIQVVPRRKRKAMEKAFFLRPSLASDKQFRLLFLRAEDFDATDAATRMIAYFEAKRILFGDDKLAKKYITLDDLSPEDIENTFYSQAIDLGEQCVDASGRPVFFTNIPNFNFDHYLSAIRGIWYVVMSLILPEYDEEGASTAISIKGVCNVAYIPPGSKFEYSIPKIIEGCHHCDFLFAQSIPCRITSAHFCYSNPAMRVPIAVAQTGLGKRARVRMRVHYGTPIELRYALLPFGIRCPENAIRISQSNATTDKKDGEEIDNYLERRREIEQRRKLIQRNREIESGIILYPHHSKDVIIGRGQSYKLHPGNHYHMELVESHLEQYIAARDNFEKTCISMKVVQTIHDEGGRFLSLVEGKGWKQMEASAARDKTAGSFRFKITNKQKAAAAAKCQG